MINTSFLPNATLQCLSVKKSFRLSEFLAYIIRHFFLGLFNKLHKNTLDETHKYLDAVYGLLYIKHKAIFFNFLSDLLSYYKNEGKESLKDRIERFFDTLYVALFHIKFNGGVYREESFPKLYNDCIKRTRKTIKPFKKEQEDAVTRLLEKFLYPSKTFVQALRVGRDFILDVIKVIIFFYI